MSLAARNRLNFIPFSIRAKSLGKVELVVQQFPPSRIEIACHRILHSVEDDRMPVKKVWKKILNVAKKALEWGRLMSVKFLIYRISRGISNT
jgi:hypothetical protein